MQTFNQTVYSVNYYWWSEQCFRIRLDAELAFGIPNQSGYVYRQVNLIVKIYFENLISQQLSIIQNLLEFIW